MDQQLTDDQRAQAVGSLVLQFSLAAQMRRTVNPKVAALGESLGTMAYGGLTMIATLFGPDETTRIRAAVQERIEVPLESFHVSPFDAIARGEIKPEDLPKGGF